MLPREMWFRTGPGAMARFRAALIIGIGSITGPGAASALASDQVTQAPFTYVIDYTPLQETAPEFKDKLSQATPTLYHPGYDMRYLGRFGFGGMVAPYRNIPYETFSQEIKEYIRFLRRQGVRWITPYLCNQTISGNDIQRYGVWEVYDRWQEYAFLGLGA